MFRRTLAVLAATTLAVPAVALAAAPAKTRTVTLTISGGHDTDPVDHGRPVVLVAAGLGVPTDVFRQAFSGVHPAGAGSGGPTEAEAQANKAALLAVLAPYGVTNDRLDEVSNRYRYMASSGETWTHRDAKATATVRNGKVVSVTLVDAGAGYSSTPTVTVPGAPTAKVTATVAYGTDLDTNGRIGSLKVASAG
jgi:hypothetical protein